MLATTMNKDQEAQRTSLENAHWMGGRIPCQMEKKGVPTMVGTTPHLGITRPDIRLRDTSCLVLHAPPPPSHPFASLERRAHVCKYSTLRILYTLPSSHLEILDRSWSFDFTASTKEKKEKKCARCKMALPKPIFCCLLHSLD